MTGRVSGELCSASLRVQLLLSCAGATLWPGVIDKQPALPAFLARAVRCLGVRTRQPSFRPCSLLPKVFDNVNRSFLLGTSSSLDICSNLLDILRG